MAAPRKHPITVEDLKEAFTYDPDTGQFFMRAPRRNHVDISKPAGSAMPGGHGYFRLTLNRISLLGHRVAWAIYYGEFPPGQIDHIDQDKQNNRISNLRKATEREISCNTPARGAVPAKGVSWHKKDRRYVANIKTEGGLIRLGRFDTVDEAAHAYNKAAIIYHGDFAVINPIGVDKL